MWEIRHICRVVKKKKCKLFIMGNGGDRPNIRTISDLRNYTAVINEVAYGNRVYLTCNGHEQCAIIDIKELGELDKQKALYQLMSKLNEAEFSLFLLRVNLLKRRLI